MAKPNTYCSHTCQCKLSELDTCKVGLLSEDHYTHFPGDWIVLTLQLAYNLISENSGKICPFKRNKQDLFLL